VHVFVVAAPRRWPSIAVVIPPRIRTHAVVTGGTGGFRPAPLSRLPPGPAARRLPGPQWSEAGFGRCPFLRSSYFSFHLLG
jgi:hypothetical protein